MTETAPAQSRPARLPTLNENLLKSAMHERGHFFVIVPSDTSFEQVMTPSYWANVVRPLAGGAQARPFAIVEVVREDGTMDLTLRVIEAKPGMVKFRVINKYISDENIGKTRKGDAGADDDSIVMPPNYKWAHVPRGANRGHMVRIEATGEILAQGLGSKLEAAQRARAHAAEANKPTVGAVS